MVRTCTHRTFIFFTIIVSSLALQSPTASQQTHLVAKALQRSTNTNREWDLLYKAFSTDSILQKDFCASYEYTKYFKSLGELSLSHMAIPPNTRILFYGNSFLQQLLNNILVANEGVLLKQGPLGGFEGNKLDEFVSQGWTPMYGFLVQWNFSINSTIVSVLNYEPLELVDHIDDLKSFLDSQQFDVAFYMNPGPRCGYIPCGEGGCGNDWCDCVYIRQDPFGCARDHEGLFRGSRSDVAPLWAAINEALAGKVYEVEPWTQGCCTWWQTDDSKHTIQTSHLLDGRACNTEDNCTNGAIFGHQCQPGRLAYISQLLVDKLKDRA